MNYKYVVDIHDGQSVVVEDLRDGSKVEVPTLRFAHVPASAKHRERHLVAEARGFRITIPIVMEHDMTPYISGAKDNLETAIRILNTENPLKSLKELA